MEKKPLWQVESRYALVTCYHGRPPMVEKIISPDRVNAGNVEWVNTYSKIFRQKLKKVGVPLAEPYTFMRENGNAIQWSPFIGPDVEKLFKEGSGSYELLVQVVSAMKGLLLQKNPKVGIDARLSNFCLGDSGLIYVDTFPPIMKYKGELIVHFPNPNEHTILEQEFFRKFKALGILRRLRFSLLEQGTDFNEEHLISAIEVVMGKSFTLEVKAFFETFPDHLPLQDALGLLSLDNPDAIREIALKLMPPKGLERDSFLREIFNLSSNYCPYNLSPARRLEKIQELFLINS